MRLLIQPGDGIQPLLKGIAGAKKRIDIVIFRFDQKEIETALGEAVARGVAVHALIAHTNRAGEESLRKLELRLLGVGVTVARTADDLVRYHAKYMIIDRSQLFVMAFNLTPLDIARSRSFAVITSKKQLVEEAVKLFEADTQRHSYEAKREDFVVSPSNSRERLTAFLRSAKKELMIYDLKISDQAMVRVLEEQANAGVKIRVIGRMTRRLQDVAVHKLPQTRLHTRTIIVDGRAAFIGSQSLREVELDGRREVGIIFDDQKVVSELTKVFEADWTLAEQAPTNLPELPAARVAKKAAKAVAREMPLVMPLLNGAVKEVVGGKAELELNAEEVEDIVKVAVKEAVREALRGVVEEAVEQNSPKAEDVA